MKLLYYFSKECILFTDLQGSKEHETLLKPGYWEFSTANIELFHTGGQILERKYIVWIMKSMYSLVKYLVSVRIAQAGHIYRSKAEKTQL